MDYKFIMPCWQDQAGDENAKIDVAFNGSSVLTDVEITATEVGSPQYVTWEVTGAPELGNGVNASIEVTMKNEYYVDADTDRNIRIKNIWYTDKADGSNYKKFTGYANVDEETGDEFTVITDFNDPTNYVQYNVSGYEEAGSAITSELGISAVTGSDVSSWEYPGFVTVWSQSSVTCTVPMEHGCHISAYTWPTPYGASVR